MSPFRRGPFRRRPLLRRPLWRRPPFARPRRIIWRSTRRLLLGTTAAILLIGGTATAIKLSQRDIERIEMMTGKSADDLNEEQLLAAMKKLGIKKLELTEEDEAAIAEAGTKNE